MTDEGGARAPSEAELKDAAGVRLVEDLVARVPGFQETYAWHVDNEHEVLDHLFFWEVVKETVLSYRGEGGAGGPDWRRVLDFLEEETRRRVPGAIEVIVTSFIHRLPYEGQPGYGIEAHLGPEMMRTYRALRPWYGAAAPGDTPPPEPAG
ncbi:hypothetical protein [Streptomyces sp. NPDC048606]|uniref:hypothetical protein n=1 Tax=Streptomyces sp. NPDC048606 TaxID=3154726 RepID=UPI003417CBBB